jgi:SAM-dependent methyltransferase
LRGWLRDSYICIACGSIPRQRHLQAILDDRFVGWEQLTIHESSPSSNYIERYAANYSSSQYLPDVPRGDHHDGVRCEDVENLTFADESIDIFVTQDVLEHVFDPARAIAEIQRVLRPGGAHVFTAPKHLSLKRTLQRAELDAAGSVVHLAEPEHHGNPIGDGRALVTYDYGLDFERLLSAWSGTSVEVFHTVDRSRGIDAEFNEVFVIGKPPAPVGPHIVAERIASEIAPREEEIADLRSQIEQLRTSTSWRVTQPLRSAADASRSVRSRVRARRP